MGLNFETIVSLRPDIVILYAQKDGKGIQKKLKRIGINSIIIYPETFERIKKSLKILAKISNKQKKCEEISLKIDEILNIIKKKSKNIKEKKKCLLCFNNWFF